MIIRNVQGNLRIICAADTVTLAQKQIHACLSEFALSDCIAAPPTAYWKIEGLSVLEWTLKAEDIEIERLQNMLAMVCHAETTEFYVDDTGVEIGCYNNSCAMETDHSLMFAHCYLKGEPDGETQ